MSKLRKTYVQLLSVPRKIASINTMISEKAEDPRTVFLSKTCFKGLIGVKSQIVYAEAVLSLLSKWDSSEKCFVLNGGTRWHITDMDVARVYGLPCGIYKLPVNIDLQDNEFAFVEWMMNRSGLRKEGLKIVKESEIKEVLMRAELSTQDTAVDFWRFYVLYALCTLLIPSSTHTVSARYMKYLETPDMAKAYNWSALIRDKLVQGISSYQSAHERTSRPIGDFYCLMHLFYDFLDCANVAQRGFTCSLNRSLKVEDIKKAIAGKHQTIHAVGAEPKKRCQHADQVAKRKYHERKIEEYKRIINECTVKLKMHEDALEELPRGMKEEGCDEEERKPDAKKIKVYKSEGRRQKKASLLDLIPLDSPKDMVQISDVHTPEFMQSPKLAPSFLEDPSSYSLKVSQLEETQPMLAPQGSMLHFDLQISQLKEVGDDRKDKSCSWPTNDMVLTIAKFKKSLVPLPSNPPAIKSLRAVDLIKKKKLNSKPKASLKRN